MPEQGEGPACCRCAPRRRASPLACLGVCALVLGYNVLGALLFVALEGGAAEESVAASQPNLRHRSRTVERLWSITEDLNILYKENWTKLAARELSDFQKVLMKSMRGGALLEARPAADRRWTFSGSFLYALTLITTIGPGAPAPQSAAGKAAAVAYACAGIPLVLLYLATVGDALAQRARAAYARLRPRAPRPPAADGALGRTPFQAALNLDSFSAGYRRPCRERARVPVPLSVLLVASYVALGTLVFHATERWTVVDGCYFSFASLATIGFGELRPGLYASTISARAEDLAVGVCCIYILVGIVVIAMCFNLIQEELSGALRGWGARGAGRVVHGAGERDKPPRPAAS